MKIGIIAEGSYPYVRGGVSSWIHMILESMPQHDFHLISISSGPRTPADRKYELPANVTGITDLILETDKEKIPSGETRLTPEEESAVRSWLMLEETDGEALKLIGSREKMGGPKGFFESRAYWRIVKDAYRKENPSSSFLDYFWMWQSMYTPLIALAQNPLPSLDLIHAVSTGYAGLLAALIKQRQGIPFLLTEHGIYSREREEEILQAAWVPVPYKQRWIRFFHQLSKQAYRQADDVITLFGRNSRYQLEAGAPEEKLKVIPNGIPFEKYAGLRPQGGGDTLAIGIIARVVPIKDIKTLLYAAKMIKDQGIPFRLTVMGPTEEDEAYYEECRFLIRTLELEGQVQFTGNVKILEYLPRFDLLVLSSISEGQPLSVLEGMAAGIPHVVTDVGSCSELIEGTEGDPFGPAGFVVPPVNPSKLAEKCIWFHYNREEGRKLGENGRRRVQAYYLTADVIGQYEALYERRGEEYGRNRISPEVPI
ncbi:GT4 family glycosyltransferase PelF [Paenibacillus aurantius]|uniref:GT4 family glycosyltransferase PelF n=1 Tax=Paenibacillus aurantius TaxID=2918900 RepID=A0AA96LBL7_9BACL|nr:GT4 family glycosyltransferase PelF [Paenibacillus aurantius]WNQ10944.1 GT4 family glycosyltransferase PelF [Paenibacillus aurantius]